MLEIIQKLTELSDSLVMVLGEIFLVLAGIAIGNGYIKKHYKKLIKGYKKTVKKMKDNYIKKYGQIKKLIKKYYNPIIKPVGIGLSILTIGIIIGGYFQAIKKLDHLSSLDGSALQTTLYKQDRENKNNEITNQGDENYFSIDNKNLGDNEISLLAQEIKEEVLQNANIVIQKDIFQYDRNSVEMVNGKLECKKDENILQWKRDIKEWKCIKPFKAVFGDVSSSVEVSSSGTLECNNNGETLFWSGDNWECGDVGSNIYTTNGSITEDREVSLGSNVLGFTGGNVGIGTATPGALLDVAGDFSLSGSLLDKDGDVGSIGQMLSSTITGTDWINNSPVPFISSGVNTINASATATITIEGDNFTDNSAVSIPGFDGTVDSVNVLSPNEMEITLTPGTAETFYDIIISNDGILNTEWPNNGENLLEVADDVILVPGDGITNWERISANIDVTQGKLVPTTTGSGWDRGAGFGTVPAGKDFLLTFKPVYMTGQSAGGYAMIGVDSSDPNHHYNTMDFALYMQNGSNFMVYENGASRGTHGTWTTSDTLGVRRIGTTIEYLKNGVVLYTSSVSSAGAVVFDSSIYRYLGVENIQIEYQN